MNNPYLELTTELMNKFGVDKMPDLIMALNDESKARERRFDIVGKDLYALYAEICSKVSASEIPPDFPQGDLLLSGGSLDDIENFMRFLNQDTIQHQVVMIKAQIEGASDLEDVDKLGERIKQKNLLILRHIFVEIDDERAVLDPAYTAALEILKQDTVYATVVCFAYLVYFIGVYNIVISDEDAYALALGEDDFKMMDALSNNALDFLDNLDNG